MVIEKPNVFEYFDYRVYLQDYYNCRKKSDATFSHRKFLGEAQIKGSVYLHRILNNQRNLTENFVPNFIQALQLTQKEAGYFKNLVLFCNAKTAECKEVHIKEMMSLRADQKIYRLNDRKLRFFEKWYYPVIRELLLFCDFRDDYNILAKKVVPKISAAQAQGAVKYLVDNGFVTKNDQGTYTQSSPLITSGDKVKSTILRTYHQKVLEQCSEALDTIPSQDRDITSLTLSVSQETYKKIKLELQQFRKHLLELAQDDSGPDMVCLVGFQLIPRTKPSPKGARHEK